MISVSTEFIKKWLPITFGCHARADRSFFLNGKQFPLCARCTGELAGMILIAITYGFYHPPTKYAILFLIPMILDGGIQLLTKYESNNSLRFLTGFLFGYSLFQLFFSSLIAAYWYGYHLV